MNEFDINRTINYAKESGELDEMAFEKSNIYNNPPKKINKVIKTVLIVIIFSICYHFLYSVVVNPMTQMNVRSLFASNGKVDISVAFRLRQNKITMLFDEDCVYDPEADKYYIIEDDVVYEYEKNSKGYWKKYPVPEFDNGLNISENVFLGYNYKRDGLLTWKLKKNVDSGDLTDVQCKRVWEGYEITGYINSVFVTIKIYDIGFVDIDKPWE